MYKIAKVRFGSIFLLALISQMIVVPRILAKVVPPDLMVIILIFYALHSGMRGGVFAGLLTGFACDMFYGTASLFYIMVLPLVGGMIGVVSEKLFKEHPLTVLMILIGAKYTIALTWYMRYKTQGGLEPFSEIFHFIVFPQLMVTIACAWPLIWVLRRFCLKAEY